MSTIPTTNVKMSDIKDVVSEDNYNLALLCQSDNINRFGLHRQYIDLATPTASQRIWTMGQSPYRMGHWRGYNHLQIPPGMLGLIPGILPAGGNFEIQLVSLGPWTIARQEWVGTQASMLIDSEANDIGGGLVELTTDGAHGFSVGNTVFISGSNHYSGEHVIQTVSANNKFSIEISYQAYTWLTADRVAITYRDVDEDEEIWFTIPVPGAGDRNHDMKSDNISGMVTGSDDPPISVHALTAMLELQVDSNEGVDTDSRSGRIILTHPDEDDALARPYIIEFFQSGTEVTTYWDVDPTYIEFNHDDVDVEKTFDVDCQPGNFTITNIPTWVNVSPTSGSGMGTTITVKCTSEFTDPFQTYQPRTVIMNVTRKVNGIQQGIIYVNVTQLQPTI